MSRLGDALRRSNSPDNPYDMLIGYDYGFWAEQGTGFNYSGVNTFLLGWMVEKITGMPFQDALTREIWRHIGAEADASIFAGRNGIPLTSGGLLANVRDVARFGVLFTPSHAVVSSRQIISDRYVDHGSQSYDLARDGESFVMIQRPEGSPPDYIVVVDNWFEELKRLVPVD